MTAPSLEDLRVFRAAMEAHAAVSALIEQTSVRRDFDLARQLSRAASSIPAQIAEGFGQKTDRHFAQYLFVARGSCNEVRVHLQLARDRRLIAPAECDRVCQLYVSEGKMLTRLIQHLTRSDRKQRG